MSECTALATKPELQAVQTKVGQQQSKIIESLSLAGLAAAARDSVTRNARAAAQANVNALAAEALAKKARADALYAGSRAASAASNAAKAGSLALKALGLIGSIFSILGTLASLAALAILTAKVVALNNRVKANEAVTEENTRRIALNEKISAENTRRIAVNEKVSQENTRRITLNEQNFFRLRSDVDTANAVNKEQFKTQQLEINKLQTEINTKASSSEVNKLVNQLNAANAKILELTNRLNNSKQSTANTKALEQQVSNLESEIKSLKSQLAALKPPIVQAVDTS